MTEEGHDIGIPPVSLQELDLRYSKAQVLLSAVKEKQEFDMDDDYYGGGSKKVSHVGE